MFLEHFQFCCDCQRLNMKSFKNIVLLIIFFAFCHVGNAQSDQNYYSCNQTSSYCVLKNFESLEKFENFLTRNSEVISYSSYYGYSHGQSMSSFINIELSGVKIEKIPSMLFRRFSNMRKLIGSDLGLKELRSEDLKQADGLKILKLPNNEIKQLENVQFIYLRNIEEIDLSYNKISSIHDGAFDKIGTNITKIDLSFNQVSIFKEDYLWLIMDVIEIKWLNINLEHNLIAVWEGSDKNKSTSVVLNLNLKNNKLKSFKLQNIKVNKLLLANNEIEDFDGNFNSIDISNNKIEELKINSESTSVLAAKNKISEIIFTTGNSSKLEIFDVSLNNLKSSQNFHEFLKNQKKISSLDLSHNFFGVFALEDFADMENLHKLSLRNTGLSELPFGLFAHLQKLQLLDLSQNNLKEIDFHVFSSLNNLEILDISGNSLSHIDEYEKLKEVLPSLKNIGLEGIILT